MAKIRALIADDEPLAREWIRNGLSSDPEIEVIGECADGLETVAAIEQHQPDVVLLDIEMPGLNGFGILERARTERSPAIIFITAYDQYALKAFDARAVDYLMKPFSRERLSEAVGRAKAHTERNSSQELRTALVSLVREVQRDRSYPEWLLLKEDGRSFFVHVPDIDWIESSRNNVLLHVGKQKHVCHETTGGIEAKLDPRRFLRIHRSSIVNIERIHELHPWFNGDYTVLLRDGTRLTMSSTYREKLKDFRRLAG
jgi:two-component system, LytTR family, response regulator